MHGGLDELAFRVGRVSPERTKIAMRREEDGAIVLDGQMKDDRGDSVLQLV